MNKELADLLDLCIEVNGEGYFPCDVLYRAREHILALEKLVEGGDIGRKVMSADLDNKERLVSDYLSRVGDLEKLVDHAGERITEKCDYIGLLEADNAILLESNAELAALLDKGAP